MQSPLKAKLRVGFIVFIAELEELVGVGVAKRLSGSYQLGTERPCSSEFCPCVSQRH